MVAFVPIATRALPRVDGNRDGDGDGDGRRRRQHRRLGHLHQAVLLRFLLSKSLQPRCAATAATFNGKDGHGWARMGNQGPSVISLSLSMALPQRPGARQVWQSLASLATLARPISGRAFGFRAGPCLSALAVFDRRGGPFCRKSSIC